MKNYRYIRLIYCLSPACRKVWLLMSDWAVVRSNFLWRWWRLLWPPLRSEWQALLWWDTIYISSGYPCRLSARAAGLSPPSCSYFSAALASGTGNGTPMNICWGLYVDYVMYVTYEGGSLPWSSLRLHSLLICIHLFAWVQRRFLSSLPRVIAAGVLGMPTYSYWMTHFYLWTYKWWHIYIYSAHA